MTNIPGKRTLPLNPHSEHLRKEAKARLAGLKTRMFTFVAGHQGVACHGGGGA
jgi:hypothetical protein